MRKGSYPLNIKRYTIYNARDHLERKSKVDAVEALEEEEELNTHIEKKPITTIIKQNKFQQLIS